MKARTFSGNSLGKSFSVLNGFEASIEEMILNKLQAAFPDSISFSEATPRVCSIERCVQSFSYEF